MKRSSPKKWIRFLPATSMLIFLFTSPVRANIIASREKLNLGITECQNGQYEKGINLIIDAAMDARRDHPNHPFNRQWRPHLLACFNDWARQENNACRQSANPVHLQNLQKIVAKAESLAGRETANRIEKQASTCFSFIVAQQEKNCRTQKSALDLLTTLESGVTDPKNKTRVQNAIRTCRDHRWKILMEECRTTFTPAFLEEVENLLPMMGQNPTLREQYRGCLMMQVQGAREMCRNRMAYTEGSLVFGRAFSSLMRIKPPDEAFTSKAAAWKDECGMFKLQLKLKTEAQTGRTKFEYPSLANLVVTRDADTGQVKACGILHLRTHNAVDGQCDVMVTALPPETPSGNEIFTGRQWFCMKGTIQTHQGRGKKPIQRLQLEFDPSMARPLVQEQIQITCPGKPAIIFKEKMMETLFQNKLFILRMDVADRTTTRFRIQEDLTRKRRFVFTGEWLLTRF